MAEHKISVDGAVVHAHSGDSFLQLHLAVLNDLRADIVGGKMAHRHAGAALEDIVAVGQDKANGAVIDESLSAVFLTGQEFLNEVGVGMGVLHHLAVGKGDILRTCHFGNAPAAGGVNGLENDRIANFLADIHGICVFDVHIFKLGGVHAVFLKSLLHQQLGLGLFRSLQRGAFQPKLVAEIALCGDADICTSGDNAGNLLFLCQLQNGVQINGVLVNHLVRQCKAGIVPRNAGDHGVKPHLFGLFDEGHLIDAGA